MQSVTAKQSRSLKKFDLIKFNYSSWLTELMRGCLSLCVSVVYWGPV